MKPHSMEEKISYRLFLMGFLGLLFGLLLFMLGMIYRRMDRVEYYARKAGSRKNKD